MEIRVVLPINLCKAPACKMIKIGVLNIFLCNSKRFENVPLTTRLSLLSLSPDSCTRLSAWKGGVCCFYLERVATIARSSTLSALMVLADGRRLGLNRRCRVAVDRNTLLDAPTASVASDVVAGAQ